MITVRKLSKPFASDGGAAFLMPLDRQIASSGWVLLLEDGRAIGTGDALHTDIRDHGRGLFSVSNGVIRFSSSDGTDCNTNGRNYEIAVLDEAKFQDIAVKRVATSFELLLKSIAESTNYNNSFFTNFFTYYRGVYDILNRNGFEVPSSVLEIGCGELPYTALRFLLEGASRFVANDLFEVRSSFSPEFVSALRMGCDAIDPSLCRNADRVFSRENGYFRAVGLEACGGQPFETIRIDGKVGLIISVSALEHVMDPESVARKMAEILVPGGAMFHSIDFRDHRHFDRPFEFLKLTADEYGPIATENRLRASDWMEILEKNGFEIIERVDQAMTAESVASGQCAYRFYPAGEKVVPTVTEAERKTFCEPFRQKSLVDLSITLVQVLCRKK